MDPFVRDQVAECVSCQCRLPCRFSPEMTTPAYAFDEKRQQYNSKLILRYLMDLNHRSLRFLAVTQLDLFVPILKYVFGLAQIEGQCAIISTYRLRPEYYGHAPNPALFMERVKKTALHELGHTMGLTHCRDRRCIMHSATTIEDTDVKRARFCPTCHEIFKWQLEQYVS
ncbi:MAG: archaemetzincin family Zn-dependent metalloprotease [Deltaproteobacteria bacterium]|nr:archaemetzincin family Zn-dependent metalloprotease [Deltaproteobacteria bacterium]